MIFTAKTVFGDSVKVVAQNQLKSLFSFKDANVIIAYFQWETVVVERNVKKNYQTAKKVMKTGSVAEVIIHLQDLLACFSIHNHTNINQLHNFKQAKKNLKKMS